MTNVTNEIDISKLKTVREIKGRVKDFFTDSQLIELAKNHQCPHFVLYNPISQVETILFNTVELNQWVVTNYVKQNQCFVPQVINIMYFNYEDCKLSVRDRVPKELHCMRELYHLPKHIMQAPPGIYFLCHKEKVVYIGQSINAGKRVQDHWSNPEKEFDTVFFIPCHIDSLTRVESALIKFFRPQYNIASMGEITRDDERIVQSIKIVA